MSTESKKQYVLGFIFNYAGDILLIEKKRPEWQAGLLNGVGGKIEPFELPKAAMSRETKEETELNIPEDYWRFVCLIEGEDYQTHVFTCIYDTRSVITTTDENIFVLYKATAVSDIYQKIDNINALIELSHLRLKHEKENNHCPKISFYSLGY